MQKAGARDEKIRRLVIVGMLAAVIVVLMVTGIGLLRIGPVIEITFLCLPVLIGVMAEGLGVGLCLGFAFGLISFIQAFSSPTLLAPYFMNPAVSVLPRLLIPVVTWLVLRELGRFGSKSAGRRLVARGIAAFAGSITNTVGVLGMVFVLCKLGVIVEGLDPNAAGAILLGAGLTNGIPEAIAMTIVTPPIMAALDRSIYKERELSK